jgi:eukaryotic-like serine/threonine-protein kinase
MNTYKYNWSLISLLILSAGLVNCSKSSDPAPPVTPPNNVTGITVTTSNVASITANAAMCGGTVTLVSGGSPITARGICWSTTPNPTTANSKTSEGFATGQFYSQITGLSLATSYYVRAYASNNIGTTYGNQVSFTTLASITAPNVATTALSALMPTSVTCGGSVLLDGGAPITARGVCWSTTPNPTIANPKTSDGTGGGIYSSNVTGLIPNTRYYIRAYATNSAGTGYGDDIEITTPEHGVVYFGSEDKNFYALNILNGQLKWKRTSSAGFGYSGPCFANGRIYAGSIDSYMYCLDTLNGNVIWSFLAGNTGIESDPVYDNGTIYFGSNDDNLYALDANTGALKWKYTTGANVSTSPVVSNGVVYFGSSDAKVYALNTSNGQLIWSYQMGAMTVSSGPLLANGMLYIGSRDKRLHAININTGMQVWELITSVSLEFNSPTIVNNILYVGAGHDLNSSNKGSLYAVNATTGQVIWESLQNTGFSGGVIVANGRVFACSPAAVYAVDANNGMFLWTKPILPNSSSPVVLYDVLYVAGGASGYFYALNVSNGAEKWKFPLTHSFTSGAAIVTASAIKHSAESGMHQ